MLTGAEAELQFGEAEVLAPDHALTEHPKIAIRMPPMGVEYYHLLARSP